MQDNDMSSPKVQRPRRAANQAPRPPLTATEPMVSPPTVPQPVGMANGQRSIERYIGFDLHKQDSQLCTLSLNGELLREIRIRTSASSLRDELATAPRSRIVVEAGTESEWVAQLLEEMGHEVVVADPNYAPMYATRTRKIKTDKRDARALAEASRLGIYRPAHRCSEAQRHIKGMLSTRENLVRSRAKQISLCRALTRQQGYRVSSGATETFAKRLGRLELPEGVRQQVGPLLRVMAVINEEIERLDAQLSLEAHKDELARLLQSMPAVGPVTALAFRAVIDQAERFDSGKKVACYLGLVPSEHSSGGDGTAHRRGAITKTGDGRVRWLLVQAAHRVLRLAQPETMRLWMWARKIQEQRGKKIAVVALARRLAGILWAMMRERKAYRGQSTEQAQPKVAAAPSSAANPT